MKLDSTITLHVSELTRDERTKLLQMLTFTDANDTEVQAYDYYPAKGTLRIPRGVWSSLPKRLTVQDTRSKPPMPKLAYAKTLNAPEYDGQIEAVMAMTMHQQGQVIAPPGRGKTEIALAFACAAKTRTLVVVHTNALFKQWVDRIADSVPGCVPGKIQGKLCQVEHITVAMAQTLARHIRDGGKFWRQFGCLIVDETHHAAAETWQWICNVCPAFYRFGVTASEKRSDGRQPLVKFLVGPVIHKLEFRSQVPLIVRPVKSGFKSRYNGNQYREVLNELIADPQRNDVIAAIVAREILAGNSILVLSREIKHLTFLYDALARNPAMVKHMLHGEVETVTGRLPRRQQHEFTGRLRDGSLRCILGTQIFEEGVDIPRLNRIILAYPGTDITVLQKVGRGTRKFDGKTETVVYDILDDLVRVLAKQFLKRRRWYRSVGIHIDMSKGKGDLNGPSGDKPDKVDRRAQDGQVKGRLRGALRVARPRRTG